MESIMTNFKEIENILGCKLPSIITYLDRNGPPFVHSALLINNRTSEILAYAVNKCVCSRLVDLTARITVHAEQELLYAMDRQIKEKRIPKWSMMVMIL